MADRLRSLVRADDGVATVLCARHRAQAAADLSALAAAASVIDPEGACGAASTIAVANGGEMASCTVDGLDAVVVVHVPAAFALFVAGAATASARAGPR
ncbi:hypothetical protein P0W64_02985 [Tsukamurella sp. 8F]|uniref:Rv3654c family TadE-like protein n=1 Tax=unclassified Tsukamurella TaxID=2633480 RepID=UPI0023B92E4A|nr:MULTISPECIES: Rv3654c family TadE-like protein [unclassified Tsukamurella]MDF0529577.1 hypothetical protein [Tsukamurella sp. 8J]MDF0585735.1 hypothetical protein [Tsukamurella sp. 8F]